MQTGCLHKCHIQIDRRYVQASICGALLVHTAHIGRILQGGVLTQARERMYTVYAPGEQPPEPP